MLIRIKTDQYTLFAILFVLVETVYWEGNELRHNQFWESEAQVFALDRVRNQIFLIAICRILSLSHEVAKLCKSDVPFRAPWQPTGSSRS